LWPWLAFDIQSSVDVFTDSDLTVLQSLVNVFYFLFPAQPMIFPTHDFPSHFTDFDQPYFWTTSLIDNITLQATHGICGHGF
jgi:hypothetical protein